MCYFPHINVLFLCRTMLLAVAMAAFSPTGSATAASPDGYMISVGDELEFDILDDNDPPQRFVVGREGAVQLPFIGGVVVGDMSVGDARQLIQRTYVQREIFVDPQIELSIGSFRPISVLGDVKNPGNFDYQPQMTAEQAVGMAGGPSISANNEEARVLELRTLEGSLNSLQFELGLLAAQYARAQAQLKHEESAVWEGVPPQIRRAISREIFEEHRTEEDRIIALQAQDAATRRKLLSDAVEETKIRIGLLEERREVQSSVLERSRAEVERATALADRGLIPKNSLNAKELEVSQAQTQLLQLREQASAAKIEQAELRSRLSQFDTELEKQLLTEAQRTLSEINKALSTRASLEDRTLLLRQWMSAAAGLETELLLEYQIRRRRGDQTENIVVKPFDEILPGDLLVIVVKPPEALGQPG